MLKAIKLLVIMNKINKKQSLSIQLKRTISRNKKEIDVYRGKFRSICLHIDSFGEINVNYLLFERTSS